MTLIHCALQSAIEIHFRSDQDPSTQIRFTFLISKLNTFESCKPIKSDGQFFSHRGPCWSPLRLWCRCELCSQTSCMGKSRNIAIVHPRHELTWTTTRNLLDRRPTSVNSFDISWWSWRRQNDAWALILTNMNYIIYYLLFLSCSVTYWTIIIKARIKSLSSCELCIAKKWYCRKYT